MALWSMVFRKKSWMIFCNTKICITSYQDMTAIWIFQKIIPAHLPGVGLWKGSPEISDTSCIVQASKWYKAQLPNAQCIFVYIKRKYSYMEMLLNAHLTLFSSPSLKSFSSSSPTTSKGLMKALPLLRGSLATRTKVASVHLWYFCRQNCF